MVILFQDFSKQTTKTSTRISSASFTTPTTSTQTTTAVTLTRSINEPKRTTSISTTSSTTTIITRQPSTTKTFARIPSASSPRSNGTTQTAPSITLSTTTLKLTTSITTSSTQIPTRKPTKSPFNKTTTSITTPKPKTSTRTLPTKSKITTTNIPRKSTTQSTTIRPIGGTTSIISVRAMETDNFCDSFDCIISIELHDVCFDYIKNPADVDCHLFCKLDNCTKQPTSEIYCATYNCFPKTTTTITTTTTTETTTKAPSPIPTNHNVAIIVASCTGVTIFFGLCLFLGICLCRRYRRTQQHSSDSIEEGPENDPNRHFVVGTPSTSSSDDFETQPTIPAYDQRLEDEAQLIIDNHRQNRAGSVDSNVSGSTTVFYEINNFKMCTFAASKTLRNEPAAFETTVC